MPKKMGRKAKENFIKKLETFKACCGTCEFNFDGNCAGGQYGAEIYDLNNVCSGFHAGMGSYVEFSNLGKSHLLTDAEEHERRVKQDTLLKKWYLEYLAKS
jgi:hypothetical protein